MYVIADTHTHTHTHITGNFYPTKAANVISKQIKSKLTTGVGLTKTAKFVR